MICYDNGTWDTHAHDVSVFSRFSIHLVEFFCVDFLANRDFPRQGISNICPHQFAKRKQSIRVLVVLEKSYPCLSTAFNGTSGKRK